MRSSQVWLKDGTYLGVLKNIDAARPARVHGSHERFVMVTHGTDLVDEFGEAIHDERALNVDDMHAEIDAVSIKSSDKALEHFMRRYHVPADAKQLYQPNRDAIRFAWPVIKVSMEEYDWLFGDPNFVADDDTPPDEELLRAGRGPLAGTSIGSAWIEDEDEDEDEDEIPTNNVSLSNPVLPPAPPKSALDKMIEAERRLRAAAIEDAMLNAISGTTSTTAAPTALTAKELEAAVKVMEAVGLSAPAVKPWRPTFDVTNDEPPKARSSWISAGLGLSAMRSSLLRRDIVGGA